MGGSRRTILVTGIAGFIGSRVAAELVRLGHEVLGIDDFSMGKEERVPKGAVLIRSDLTTVKFEKVLPGNIDDVIHLAGQSSAERSFLSPKDDLLRNSLTTLRLLEFGKSTQIGRFILASSMAVYGATERRRVTEATQTRPISPYGASKASAELYLKAYANDFPSIAMRMFSVYGPGQSLSDEKHGIVGIFLSQALSGSPVVVKGSLDRIRDLVFIDDVVRAYVASLEIPLSGPETVNLGSGVPTSLLSLLEIIRDLTGPFSIIETCGTPGDQFQIVADTSKMQALLGLQNLTSLGNGLKSTVEYAQAISQGDSS